MFNHVASLIPMTNSVNAYGDPVETQGTPKQVFCRVVSADEKEKTYAESRGETAELVIIIADKALYSNEKYVDFENTRYRVINTKFGDSSRELRLVVGKWQVQ